jgi:NADH-quinone oxidoreductase subunit N
MAGIPPIVGFLAKIFVFLEVIKSSAYFAAFLSILFSTISTFYYIRVIKVLYFENVMVGKLYEPITTKKSILISILTLALILLFLDPTVIYLLFEISALINNF